MLDIKNGQCGTCSHFGGQNAGAPQLVQIRISGQAEPDLVQPCGHPDNAPRDLQVSPVSTCAGYSAA